MNTLKIGSLRRYKKNLITGMSWKNYGIYFVNFVKNQPKDGTYVGWNLMTYMVNVIEF
jgi:hypothetical protein